MLNLEVYFDGGVWYFFKGEVFLDERYFFLIFIVGKVELVGVCYFIWVYWLGAFLFRVGGSEEYRGRGFIE